MENTRVLVNNPFVGANYFFQGLRLIFSKGLRRYILAPVIVNIFLMLGIIILFAVIISHYLLGMISHYPQWLLFILGSLFWVLYGVVSLLVGTIFFTMLTNIIASPFYGLLAEAVEEKLHGTVFPKTELKDMLPLLYHIFLREFKKLLYFIPWLLLCLGFLIFPLTWILFPWVWWAIMSWIMSIQYSDYAADNQKVPLKEMITALKEVPLTSLGFGATVAIALALPIFNLITPAASVAGGTILWNNIKNKKNHINK